MSGTTNTTLVWAALLTACEGTVMDLSEAEPFQLECAEQMQQAGILSVAEPHCYILTSDGMKLLQLVENLRDYSLGIN